MEKPKVERGWIEWHPSCGFIGQLWWKQISITPDRIRSGWKLIQVEIRPITKKKGVRRGK